MDKRFGLKTNCIKDIINVLKLQSEVEEALIFGSRAMGTYKNGSDIDIALKGEKITFDTIATIRLRLDELPYLYMYDIIDYKKISNPAVTAHIDELGITFYKKEEVPSEWKTYKLGDFITHKKGFAFKSDLYKNKGCPIIRVTNFTGNSISMNDILFIDIDQKINFKEVEIKEDDIIIATVGSWPNNPSSIVGRVIKVPKVANGALLNQNAVIIYPNKNLDKKFLYYLLKEKNFSNYLVAGAQGSANQASIKLEQIYSYEFSAPKDKVQQQEIAQILTSLDDKIELNLQMNQTLEAMAQALFKEWFVNFNFPGFDGELENGLPKGWRMGKLGDICSNVRVSFNPYRDGFITNYIGLEHIPRRSIMLLDWGNSEDINSQKSQFVKGDILFGKLRPYFHKVIVAPFDGICSTDILVIRALENKFHSYSYFHLFSDECIKYSNSQSDGTRMPRVNWNSLSNYEIPIPSKDILGLFQQTISPIFEKVYLSIFENQSLTHTRDTLLPKLMSGKIELKN